MTGSGAPSRVLGACPHDCPDTCSLVTTVQDGVAIRVQGNPEHPQTGGVLCNKVSRYTERTYHPERLLHPLRRVGPKGSGRFERVDWDTALADIAARLGAIAARDPQAIVPYSYAGTMGQVQGEGMAARFFNRIGASLLDRTICSTAGGEGLRYTLGGKVGMRVEFFAESRLIIIWGSNPITSNLHFWRHAQHARRLGARLVCIDPRKSETADKCDEHIALLPGTDAALALALMHELIAHDWLDHDYIARYTLGWQALRERALQWTPERAAAVCGVPASQIRALARDYGQCLLDGTPAAIRLNYGMQRVRGGGNAARAIASLPALTGAWRHRAGGVLLSSSGWFPVDRAALHRPDLKPPQAVGQPRTINMITIGNDLLAPASPAFGPKIEALIVYNSNPVAVAPESGKVVQGFAREDLFTVVLEHFQTDTADYADYVLPATTQLEHWDVHSAYGHTDVLLNRPAIAPLGEARTNTSVFRAMARGMGLDEPCFDDSDETLCRTAFGARVDFSGLMDKGFATLALPDAPFAEGGFLTPSGKCEFFSARLASLGMDGLPDHLANHEPVGSSAAYPLAMISPPARNFLNSTFVNVKSLRDMEGEPVLEMHGSDAAARGISSGAVVRVFNDRGDYLVRAEVSARARPGVVNGLGIWWRKLGLDGTNVNQLTSQQVTDLGAGPVFYDCLVEVALASDARLAALGKAD
ncbi:MAG: molybdopterin oxidoreductase [Polaromonas sp.]|nr:molybdopterin oxidoreductase [Polaromonas sp.]